MPYLRDEPRRERVAALREQGMSFREIGRTLGISHEQARQDARAANLTALTGAPDALGARGQQFWDRTVTAIELDWHEQELLTQICRLLDRADDLRAEINERGVMVDAPRGGRRPNPAVAEERQVSLALGRLLTILDIPAPDDDPAATSLRSGFSVRASRAASSRWGRVRREQEARDGA